MKKLIVIFAAIILILLSLDGWAQHRKGSSVVIIDPELPSVEILLKQIHPDSRIVYLEKSDNPLAFILKTLRKNAPVSALHIMSAGNPGQLVFSGNEISGTVLQRNEEVLGLWKENFSQHGDILLYGCEVAKGYAGIEFVKSLAILTGLDIAASDNLTGSYKKRGDWYLEVKSGRIETRLIVSQKIIEQYPNVLRTNSISSFSEPRAQVSRKNRTVAR